MDGIIVLLVVVHIVAMVAGGSNGVLNMLAGPMLKGATPDAARTIYALQDACGKIGKISMAVLVVSGLAVLGLKWHFTPPNAWFWLKMAGFVTMFTCILLGERQTAQSRSGGPAAFAAIRAKVLYGQLTSIAFLVVLLGVVLTFLQ